VKGEEENQKQMTKPMITCTEGMNQPTRLEVTTDWITSVSVERRLRSSPMRTVSKKATSWRSMLRSTRERRRHEQREAAMVYSTPENSASSASAI